MTEKKTTKQTEITHKRLSEIKPYDKNPRNNDAAVQLVTNSIKEFGFKVPIVIDKAGVIVCGHTRYKAAQDMGLDSVPCIIADDLTPQQVKAYRLADNKVGEASEWNMDKLAVEISGCTEFDMTCFGFDALRKEAEEVDIDAMLSEFEMKNAVERPIWATMRTTESNRHHVDEMVGVMAQRGIKVEVSYHENVE